MSNQLYPSQKIKNPSPQSQSHKPRTQTLSTTRHKPLLLLNTTAPFSLSSTLPPPPPIPTTFPSTPITSLPIFQASLLNISKTFLSNNALNGYHSCNSKTQRIVKQRGRMIKNQIIDELTGKGFSGKGEDKDEDEDGFDDDHDNDHDANDDDDDDDDDGDRKEDGQGDENSETTTAKYPKKRTTKTTTSTKKPPPTKRNNNNNNQRNQDIVISSFPLHLQTSPRLHPASMNLQILNDHTLKRIREEMCIGIDFCKGLERFVYECEGYVERRGMSGEKKGKSSRISVERDGERELEGVDGNGLGLEGVREEVNGYSARADTSNQRLKNNNKKRKSGNRKEPSGVDAQSNGNAFLTSKATTPLMAALIIDISNITSTLRKSRKSTPSNPLPSTTALNESFISSLAHAVDKKYLEQIVEGKRILSKKECSLRVFELMRYSDLQQGEVCAARVSGGVSEDVYILARVCKAWKMEECFRHRAQLQSLPLPLTELNLMGSEKRLSVLQPILVRDADHPEVSTHAIASYYASLEIEAAIGIASNDRIASSQREALNEDHVGLHLISRDSVLPLPSTPGASSAHCQHLSKGSKIYALYPNTTTLYPAVVVDNMTYCQGLEDVVVVEFDDDYHTHAVEGGGGVEGEVGRFIPQRHCLAKYCTILPREGGGADGKGNAYEKDDREDDEEEMEVEEEEAEEEEEEWGKAKAIGKSKMKGKMNRGKKGGKKW